MIAFVSFVVLVLATARLTRLASIDEITAPIRLGVDKRANTSKRTRLWRRLSELLWCYWCSGVWVAGFTSAYALAVADHLGYLTTQAALMAWPLLFPAVAYAASWTLDKETT